MFPYKLCVLTCFVISCAGDRLLNDCGLLPPSGAPLLGNRPEVAANKFPWHVALFEDRGTLARRRIVLICGGSIVRSNVVISAAHCFSQTLISSPVNVDAYRIVAGTPNASFDAQDPGRQESQVLDVHLGENYGGGAKNWQQDIAFVILKSHFTFSNAVRAVCLELEDYDFNHWQTSPGVFGKVNVWGNAEAARGLRIMRVPVVSDRECTKEMPPSYIMYITKDKICAGSKNDSAVCPGDGGGGLVFPLVRDTSRPPAWFLRGVLSNAPRSTNLSDPCSSNTLALYTNIFEHNLWISDMLETLQPATKVVTEVPSITTVRSKKRGRSRHLKGTSCWQYLPDQMPANCPETT